MKFCFLYSQCLQHCLVNLFIFLIILTLDYLLKSQRVWIIKIQLYTLN